MKRELASLRLSESENEASIVGIYTSWASYGRPLVLTAPTATATYRTLDSIGYAATSLVSM